MRTLCFDLDGTLCSNTEGAYEEATPFPWAIARVNELARAGHRIIIFTARGTATGIDWEAVTREQLERWGVTYHDLRFGKPSADVYVDDRAVHTDAWRRGDAFDAPGLAVAPDGEPPAYPAADTPHLAAVVELGRTFDGRAPRLGEHAERLVTLARAAGLGRPPSAREVAREAHRFLDDEARGGDVAFSLCLQDAGHIAHLDTWDGQPQARLHVSRRGLADSCSGLARMRTTGYDGPAVAATVDAPAAGAWPLSTDRRGTLSAGLGARLGVVRAGSIVIEPDDAIRGVALQWLKEIGAGLGVTTVEHPITPKLLEAADEVLLVGFPFCLLPVAVVDGRPLEAIPGPVTTTVLNAWSSQVGVDIAAQTAALLESDPAAAAVRA